MPDHEEQVCDAASVREDAALEEMRREVVALRRNKEELRVRAERDALIAEAERLAAGERVEAAARGTVSTAPTSGQGAQTGTSHLSNFRHLFQSRSPKFDHVEEHFGMWSSKFQAHLSSLGCLYVRKATVPSMVGDTNVSQEELARRHTKEEIKDARSVYGLLMEAMTDNPVVKFCMQQAMLPSGAWEALLDFCMPRTLATRHRVKKEFRTIRMVEREDALLLLGRVEKAADQLATLGCSKSVEEINKHIVNKLSSLYEIQSKSIISCPNIPRAEIDEIIRDACLNDEVKNCLLYTSPSPRD